MERGRPRSFDREQALDAALAVFWRDGYLGASLSALTEAMGINKPSLYAAFGNKADLYMEALGQYCRQQLFRHAQALGGDRDIKTALRGFLRSVADMATAKEYPGGCMVVNSAVACESGLLPGDVAEATEKTITVELADVLKNRLREESRKRGWPAKKDVDAVADYIIAVVSGMAVMSRVGVGRERLYNLIDQSLQNLGPE